MGLFRRAAKVVESELHDRKDKAQTPEEALQAAQLKMMEQVGEVKQQLGEIEYAHAAVARQLDESADQLATLQEEAEQALQAGDEERARNRLTRRQSVVAHRAELAARAKVLESTRARLSDALEELRDQLSQFRDQRAAIDGRYRTAEADLALHKAQQALTSAGSEALDLASQQAREVEARAELSETIEQQLERLRQDRK